MLRIDEMIAAVRSTVLAALRDSGGTLPVLRQAMRLRALVARGERRWRRSRISRS